MAVFPLAFLSAFITYVACPVPMCSIAVLTGASLMDHKPLDAAVAHHQDLLAVRDVAVLLDIMLA